MPSEAARKRLVEAEGFLEEAEHLHNERISNLHTLTKLYHAMIYSLLALFDIGDIGGRTHAEIIGRFESEYVRKGAFDRSLLDALRSAYDVTHECDCAHMKQPDDEEIERLLPLARRLVSDVGSLLSAR